MRDFLVAAAAALSLAGGAANAAIAHDPVGDFLPSYSGAHDADLDVTLFSVDYNAAAMSFDLFARFAGDINPAVFGAYIIGVDTGTHPAAPFGPIDNPNVRFNDVIVLFKDGSGFVDIPMDPTKVVTATISGDSFSLSVPLSLLPSTGFIPERYGFNLWPRDGLNPPDLSEISDFAPDDATIAAVPEPATWAMLILGFGIAGAGLRRRRMYEVQPGLV